MSTVILFSRKYLRYNANIQHCFSLQRKSRLLCIVIDSPWASGLSRLLAERRGLNKEDLATLVPPDKKGRVFRPAMISKLAKGRTDRFLMSFLVRLAIGFTTYDRKLNLDAPDVELWEFFVSDEQAAVLRERALKTRAESGNELLVKQFAEFLKQGAPVAMPAPPPPVIVEVQKRKGGKRR